MAVDHQYNWPLIIMFLLTRATDSIVLSFAFGLGGKPIILHLTRAVTCTSPSPAPSPTLLSEPFLPFYKTLILKRANHGTKEVIAS